MAVVAGAVQARGRARHPWAWVGVVSFGAAYLYAAMRVSSGWALYRAITAPCSNLALPNDHACTALGANAVAGRYVLASVMIGVALAVPGAILAAAGRKIAAFVPLAVAAIAGVALTPISWFVPGAGASVPAGVRLGLFDGGSDPAVSFWAAHATLAVATDIALVALPTVAVLLLVRPRARGWTAPSRDASIRAGLVCAAGVVAVVIASAMLGILPGLAERLLMPVDGMAWFVPCATIVAFGAALGTDRRWWPWVLAPVAVLLSGAPSQLLVSQGWGYSDASSFASAIPLVLVGLIASAWAPLATHWSPGLVWAEGDAGDHPGHRRPWATDALNGAAAGLLAVSFLAAVVSPLPAQLAEALPTYIGLRTGAQDLRAKMNLQEGLSAMDSFREARGTYAGFDATTGHRVEPGLAWQNGKPTRFGTKQDLVVRVISAEPGRAELLALSESGTAFCLREDRRTGHRPALTYGSAAPSGGASGAADASATAVSAALASCGSIPWSGAAVRPIDVSSICDLARDRSMLMCQAAKRVVIQTLWRRTPFGV